MEKTALITGAANGIGAAFSSNLAGKGYNLILVDRQQEELADRKSKLENIYRISVDAYTVDLSSQKDVEILQNKIRSFGAIEMLVNAAGFATGMSFMASDIARHIAMINVHILTSVALCYSVIPIMIQRKKGAIINIASLGGFVPGGGDIMYGSTKRFLIHFSQSLQYDLKNTPIKVQALCPGFTYSNFHKSSKSLEDSTSWAPPQFWMTPDDVAASSLKALSESKGIHIPGSNNQILYKMRKNQIFIKVLFRIFKTYNKVFDKYQ